MIPKSCEASCSRIDRTLKHRRRWVTPSARIFHRCLDNRPPLSFLTCTSGIRNELQPVVCTPRNRNLGHDRGLRFGSIRFQGQCGVTSLRAVSKNLSRAKDQWRWSTARDNCRPIMIRLKIRFEYCESWVLYFCTFGINNLGYKIMSVLIVFNRGYIWWRIKGFEHIVNCENCVYLKTGAS